MMSGMNTADQVLAYLKVLVWPVIVAFALVLFRDPIRALLGGIEEFEGFGFKAKIRRQVTQAASDSEAVLAGSPIERTSDGQVGIRALLIISVNMRNALNFGSRLVPRPGDSTTDQLQRMRQIVDRLDTIIIAVLAATTSDDSVEVTPRTPRMNGPDIERYMVAITGWAGWHGVIEARDILRSTLATLCGKRGQAVQPAEVILFVTAADHAFRHWRTLVNDVAESAGSQAR
jgi:hypothetical protein